jgi:hypothetical protein
VWGCERVRDYGGWDEDKRECKISVGVDVLERVLEEVKCIKFVCLGVGDVGWERELRD